MGCYYAQLTKRKEETMKNLQIVFSHKEKLTQLLLKIEGLKTRGEITDEQYASAKSRYERLLANASAILDGMEKELEAKLGMAQAKLVSLTQVHERMVFQFKAGEIPAKDLPKYPEREQKVLGKIQKAKTEVTRLRSLFNTKGSTELGGQLDVNIDDKLPTSLGQISFPSINVEDIIPASISGLSMPSLSKIGNAGFTGSSIFPAIVGFVMVVAVFLNWVTAKSIYANLSESATGTANGYGTWCLFMGIASVVLAFMQSRWRGIGHLATGLLSLIGVLAFWSVAKNEVGSSATLTPGVGIILFGIAAVIILITGLVEMKRS